MELIMALLLYVLGSVATVSMASIFGVSVNLFQAAAVWIVFSLAVSIVKNF